MLNSTQIDDLGKGCHRPIMKVKPIKKNLAKDKFKPQRMYHIFVCRLSFSHGELQSESKANEPNSARFGFILSELFCYILTIYFK